MTDLSNIIYQIQEIAGVIRGKKPISFKREQFLCKCKLNKNISSNEAAEYERIVKLVETESNTERVEEILDEFIKIKLTTNQDYVDLIHKTLLKHTTGTSQFPRKEFEKIPNPQKFYFDLKQAYSKDPQEYSLNKEKGTLPWRERTQKYISKHLDLQNVNLAGRHLEAITHYIHGIEPSNTSELKTTCSTNMQQIKEDLFNLLQQDAPDYKLEMNDLNLEDAVVNAVHQFVQTEQNLPEMQKFHSEYFEKVYYCTAFLNNGLILNNDNLLDPSKTSINLLRAMFNHFKKNKNKKRVKT